MKPIYSFLLFVMLVSGCTSSKKNITAQQNSETAISVNGKLFTAVYQQKAAEYHALCLQAYNIARLRLDEKFQTSSSKPRAIITDIDETILDNSASAVHQALQGKDYEATAWTEWTSLANADTVPGAWSFLKYAASKNVEVFYITNRNAKDKEGTLRNLQKFNFPNADETHLVLKQTTSSKETRRQDVMRDHEVVLLLGDNLSDFSSLFDRKSTEERMQAAKNLAGEFGNRFIVLPNPGYGDWESSLYNYNYQLTAAQKDSVIRKNLKGY